jgi:hypothetical protein
MNMVQKVLDNNCRQYRAGFALTLDFDSGEAQKALFKDYDKIENINQDQRIGASLIVDDELRDWFDSLSDKIVVYIQNLDLEGA